MESKQPIPLKAALNEFKQQVDQLKLVDKFDATLFAGKNTGYLLTVAVAAPPKKSGSPKRKLELDEFEELSDNEEITSTNPANNDTTIIKAFYNLWTNLDCVFNSWSGLPSLITRDTNRTQIKNDIAAVFSICSNPANADSKVFFDLISAFQPVLAAFIETKNSYLANFPKNMRENVGGKGDVLLFALQVTLEAAIKQHHIKQAQQRFPEELKKIPDKQNQLKLIAAHRDQILRQAFNAAPTVSGLTPVIAMDEKSLIMLQEACTHENEADQTALKEHLNALANQFIKQIDNTPHVGFVQQRMGINYCGSFAAYAKTLIDTLDKLKEHETELLNSLRSEEESKNNFENPIPIPQSSSEGTRLLGNALNATLNSLHQQKTLLPMILRNIEKLELLASQNHASSQHNLTQGSLFEKNLLDNSTRMNQSTINKEKEAIQQELIASQIIQPLSDERKIQIEMDETKASVGELDTWQIELRERQEALQKLKAAIEAKGLMDYLESNQDNRAFVCEKLAITPEQLNRFMELEATLTAIPVGNIPINMVDSYRASDQSLHPFHLIDKVNQEIALNEALNQSVTSKLKEEKKELENLAKTIEQLKNNVQRKETELEEINQKLNKLQSSTTHTKSNHGTQTLSSYEKNSDLTFEPTDEIPKVDSNIKSITTPATHTRSQLIGVISLLFCIGIAVGAALLLSTPLGIGIAIGIGVGITVVGSSAVAGVYKFVTREKALVNIEDISGGTASQPKGETTDENSTTYTDSPISQPGNTTHPSGTSTIEDKILENTPQN